MKKEKYLGRGIHNDKFKDALLNGHLKTMLDVIKTEFHEDFELQIRDNYINIYYLGGNIAKINNEKSIQFDEFYFLLDNSVSRAEILKDAALVTDLKMKRDQLCQKFLAGEYSEYFSEAKKVMDLWFKQNPKPERKEQHQLALENRFGKSDYTIIDLEYTVSAKSPFACTYPVDKPKKPRFDIIAVNKSGKLCVIEFKKGTGALAGASGLKEHYECYKYSIGQNSPAFMDEMKNLLAQKQSLNLIDCQVKIEDPYPKFIFAYSYITNDLERENRIFDREFNKIKDAIHVLKLKKGSMTLLD